MLPLDSVQLLLPRNDLALGPGPALGLPCWVFLTSFTGHQEPAMSGGPSDRIAFVTAWTSAAHP